MSTGPCIGHVTPEASAGGPIGSVRDGDRIQIEIDTVTLAGSVDVVQPVGGEVVLARPPHPGLAARRAELPDDTRLWAALQARSGGSWGGCVYDVGEIERALT